MKGISPLIATVLLIAFTVTIGTIVASWTSTFSQSSLEVTRQKAGAAITCSFGDLKIDKAAYSNSNTRLSVWLKNQAGTTDLSNITFSVIMKNSSTFRYQPLPAEGLAAGEIKLYFNNTIIDGCNLDSLVVSTNCLDAKDSKTGVEIDSTGC